MTGHYGGGGGFWGISHWGSNLPALTFSGFSFPLLPGGWAAEIYNADGLKVWETGSTVGAGITTKIEFDLESSGCGAFTWEMVKAPPVVVDRRYKVVIRLFGQSAPWYTGQVVYVPKPGRTDETYKLTGFGYFRQLDDCVIYPAVTVTNKTIMATVKKLITEYVEPRTDIVYAESKITAGDYLIQSWKMELDTAKKSLQDLAGLQQNVSFGVDALQQFFFQAEDSSVNAAARFWVGKHIDVFTPEEDDAKLKNRIYLKSGKRREDKTNLVGTLEDAASIAAYGLRETVLTIPSALADDDALRWGEYQLSTMKSPLVRAKVTGFKIPPGTKILAQGMAQINCLDGSVYELPIKRVKYAISPENSVLVSQIEVSDKVDRLAGQILDLMRKIQITDALGSANMSQV